MTATTTSSYPRVAANDVVADHRNRALDLGLRLTSTNSCPRRLIKRPHLEWECWCTSRLNDHGRRYRDSRDRPVVLWEPYDAYPVERQEVFDAATADGLRVSLTGLSPWNPGHTFALVLRAEEAL